MNKKAPLFSMVNPPLIYMGFGEIYPSIPVLSGFLESIGVKTKQFNLNEAFLNYLLSNRLKDMCCGDFGLSSNNPDRRHLNSLSARIIDKNKHLLRTEEKKTLYSIQNDNAELSQLLSQIAKPYSYDQSIDNTIEEIKSLSPIVNLYKDFYLKNIDIIAQHDALVISVAMGVQLLPTLILAREAKNKTPDLPIIVGGPVFTLLDDSEIEKLLRKIPWIDLIGRSDGEPILEVFSSTFDEGRVGWEKIPGVSFIDEKNHFIKTETVSSGNLKDRAFAKYDSKMVSEIDNPTLSIIQTKGCYWGKCAYCDFVELYEGNRDFRNRPPKSTLDEIKFQIEEHGINRIEFVTESIPPASAKKISRDIIESNLDVKWSSFVMVDKHFDDEAFSLMAQSGCVELVVGMESMNDRILSHVHKAATREMNIEFVQKANANGINLHLNIIPDLPTTNFSEGMRSLEDFKAIGSQVGAFSVFPFEVTRSSKIGQMPNEYGLKVKHSEESSSKGQAEFSANHIEILDVAMNFEERDTLIAECRSFCDAHSRKSSFERYQRKYCSHVIGEFKLMHKYINLELDEFLVLTNWKLMHQWKLNPILMPLFNSLKRFTVIDEGNLDKVFSEEGIPLEFKQQLEKMGYLIGYLCN